MKSRPGKLWLRKINGKVSVFMPGKKIMNRFFGKHTKPKNEQQEQS
jgi:hypothetical protein